MAGPTIRRVVGLAYDPTDTLPRVVLKGVGPIAECVETEFRRVRAGHRVVENTELAEKLFRLPMESDISPDLYELVALLLVHVFAVEASLKGMAYGRSD